MRNTLLITVLMVAAACGKKDEKKEAAPAAPAPAKPAEAAPAPTEAAPTPAAPATPTASAVDTCKLVSKEKVEAIAGKLMGDYTAGTPSGSLLGECKGLAENAMVSISARPASEFDATVGSRKDKHDVSGLGAKAAMTDVGLLVQPSGTSYFLQIMALDSKTTKANETISIALAKAALENAK